MTRGGSPDVGPGDVGPGDVGPQEVDTDVAVVGAGPAGTAAALAAARAGVRVTIVDRGVAPRYKRCGGGLVGPSLTAVRGAGVTVPARDETVRVAVSRRAGRPLSRRADAPLLPLVLRSELDAALLQAAERAGARVVQGTTVTAVRDDTDRVVLATAAGPLTARAVVGADGSASRLARSVGVRCTQVDLGLESEVPVPPAVAAAWRGRLLLDFGRTPGAYGWVFPKGDVLTVGVIGARTAADGLRADLAALRRRHGLEAEGAHDGGHLVRVRDDDSPLGAGRVLLAGDAAGLAEPWMREGISYALRSGRLAGEAAASLARETPGDRSAAAASAGRAVAAYSAAVTAALGAEMAAGRTVLAAFHHAPDAFVALLLAPGGWGLFARLVSGDAAVARQVRRPAVRAVLRALDRAA